MKKFLQFLYFFNKSGAENLVMADYFGMDISEFEMLLHNKSCASVIGSNFAGYCNSDLYFTLGRRVYALTRNLIYLALITKRPIVI